MIRKATLLDLYMDQAADIESLEERVKDLEVTIKSLKANKVVKGKPATAKKEEKPAKRKPGRPRKNAA